MLVRYRSRDVIGGVLILIAFASLAMVDPQDPVSIHVVPRTLFAGGTVRVTCTVPPTKENRWLNLGVDGYTRSSYGLEGEDAATTHRRTYENVPCHTGPAFCEVITDQRKVLRVSEALVMAGCGDPTH